VHKYLFTRGLLISVSNTSTMAR